MPSDSSGNYSLPAGYLAVAGDTIQPSQHNPPLEDLGAAATARLMRSGAGPMTGPIKLADGLVGAPGMTFGSALTTGFFKTTAGFAATIGGTQVAEFTSTGISIPDKSITQPKLFHPSTNSLLLGTNANPALTITGAASNGGPNLIRLTVGNTATFTTGQKKTVSDVTGTTEANGLWTITVIDTTHIDLQGSVFTNSYVSGGTIGGGVDEIKLGAGLALTGDTLAASIDPALVPGHISGLTLSAAGSTGTFGIAAGVANDAASGGLMSLASAYTKTTSSWAVGSGNGALDTGSVAINTWYHVYLIKRTDTGVVDVLFSTSASSPTMPSSYTLKRRIGSMKTDGSSQWLKFTQIGDEFLWAAQIAELSAQNSSGTRFSLTLGGVPTGVVVMAHIRMTQTNGAGGAMVSLFTSLLENDVAAAAAEGDLQANASQLSCGNFDRLTSTAAQIGFRTSSTNGTVSGGTYGWRDYRGKS